jgi:hypothetical protein
MTAPKLWLHTNGFCAAPLAPLLLGEDLGADAGELTADDGDRTGARPPGDGGGGTAGFFSQLARSVEPSFELSPVGQGMQVPRSAY